MPVAASRNPCPAPPAVNVDPPVAASQSRKPSAGTKSTAVSAARDSRPPMFTFFFTRPYVANENASTSETQGGLPYPIARTRTAATLMATAAHWAGRSRSPSAAGRPGRW